MQFRLQTFSTKVGHLNMHLIITYMHVDAHIKYICHKYGYIFAYRCYMPNMHTLIQEEKFWLLNALNISKKKNTLHSQSSNHFSMLKLNFQSFLVQFWSVNWTGHHFKSGQNSVQGLQKRISHSSSTLPVHNHCEF